MYDWWMMAKGKDSLCVIKRIFSGSIEQSSQCSLHAYTHWRNMTWKFFVDFVPRDCSRRLCDDPPQTPWAQGLRGSGADANTPHTMSPATRYMSLHDRVLIVCVREGKQQKRRRSRKKRSGKRKKSVMMDAVKVE